MNAVRMRITGRLLGSLLLLALLAPACSNYHTIGAGPEGIQIPTKSSGAKTQPTPTKPKSRPASQPTTPADTTVYCRLSDLTPAATWTAAGDTLAGSLTLANYWNVPCTLKGQLNLGLTDDSGVDFSIQLTAPTPGSKPPTWLFKPNAVGEIRFTWQNWCLKPKGALRVTVTMAGQGQPVLYVPVRDQAGNLLSNAPKCIDQKKSSTLTEEGLRLIK